MIIELWLLIGGDCVIYTTINSNATYLEQKLAKRTLFLWNEEGISSVFC